MRVLLVGSGGREHALAWKISQSPLVEKLFIAPGNPGTAQHGENVPIPASDIEKLTAFARDNRIDLVIPGPEVPLILGLKDALKKAGIPCFGPDAYAARLEGSKSFAKEVMRAAGVPTAASETFTDLEKAKAYIKKSGAPIVIKADGLAAGKGVVVAQTEEEALDALERMLGSREFGEAGTTVVVEEALEGEEASFLVFCLPDGTVLPLPSAQDHKAVFDGDAGPNTGGMGAYSPAPILPDAEATAMVDQIIRPVLKEMERRGHPFTGILYAGLMLTSRGPRVLEFNVRFGDPECQPLLMRLDGDILPLMHAAATGDSPAPALSLKPGAALCVVIAAQGYPDQAYARGMAIEGIARAESVRLEDGDEVKVFIAGAAGGPKSMTASGGRILGVTARAATLQKAHDLAYRAVGEITLPSSHFRKDIGMKGLRRQKEAASAANAAEKPGECRSCPR